MHCADSQYFFESSNGPQLDNTLQARFLCLRDFLKKCALFPFGLLVKTYKTFFRGMGVCFGAVFILITVGSSASIRRWFFERIANFAKDLADWFLLPLALIGCFLRLLLAFLFHPNFYFNGLA